MSVELKIDELVSATGGELLQKGTALHVSDVSIDSRKATVGSCFVAIPGAHFDGTDFVASAVEKGSTVCVVSKKIAVPANVSLILVKDTVAALGGIASAWRSRFTCPCVAITGSNGKSTTKQMVSSAIRSLGEILKTEGNFNNLIGLPLTVFRWTNSHAAAVLEMGMNAPGEITQLTKIARPDVGLITNVSSAHLEKLHNIDNVAAAKGELFANISDKATIIVNLEDPRVKKLAEKRSGPKYTFGMQNNADVRFGRMESRGLESIDATIYVEGKEYSLHLKVPGAHNVMNAMAAIAIARVLGVSPDKAIEGIAEFQPMAMRMEKIVLASGIQLVNDCYNANPLSMKEAIRTVSGTKRAGRFVAVLGDMLELGDNAPACHEEVGRAAAEHKVDKLFIFGNNASHMAAGAKTLGMNAGRVEIYNDMSTLQKDVLSFVKAGDVVLVKGSRGMKMERVAQYLIDEMGVE